MDRFDVSSFYRPGLTAILCLTLFACSGGGGCSSCTACGIYPIPGGYPTAERIDNAAQVRLTSSGIGYIEDNIDPIVGTLLPGGLDFPIPRSSFSFVGTATVCPDSDCVAHLEIRSIDIVPTAPNRLRAHIEVYIQSRDTSGTPRGLPIDYWACSGNINLDSGPGSRPIVGFNADIVFAEETRDPRTGYTRLIVENAALDPSQPIENQDIEVRDCLLSGLVNLFRGQLVGLLEGQLSGLLDSAIGDNLCTTRGDYGCPTGTFSVPDEDPASICRFGPAASAECVPMLLGMDGRGDLGGTLIGGFSPGTHAYAQILLASGGDGEAVNEGMSLFFYGGFMGTDRTFTETPAHHSCVPVIEPPPLPTIPRTDAFRGNVIPGTTNETHVGIGLAEDYLNYAGYGMFDSGALCIGAGTRLSQQLSTGLVSAAVMSLPDLTFPEGASALTISVRPQQPPTFTVGAGTDTDPLLTIALPEVQIDFYVWSTERYIRFMTFQTDLTIRMNLVVEGGQIVPMILGVDSANSSVSNSELLSERPDALAGTLETIIGSFAGMLTSGLSGFDLPAIMGFNLVVPEGGITNVSEGGDNFLGIFANLALAGPAPVVLPTETSLEVTDLDLDRESMDPAHWAQGPGNRLWLSFGAQGPLGVEYEYSYRVDGGPWSAWTTDERIQISDDILLLQARHEVEARARVLGEPASTDPTPAMAEVLVDILPPTLNVARTVEGIEVHAEDLISPAESLEYRFFVDSAWTDWGTQASLSLPTDAEGVLVEVRDESGNVGRAEAALIRGLPNSSVAGGCGCTIPATDTPLPLGLLGLLGALGLVTFRRRRRGQGASARGRLPFLGFLGLMALVAVVASGCDCGGPQTPCGGLCVPHSGATPTGQVCCEATDLCTSYDADALCERAGYTCAPENVVVSADEICSVTCSMCMPKPAIDPGVLAQHLDMVVDDSGTVSLSGYSPGAPGRELGDLVFGTWNGTSVDWEIVDGAPTTPITNDPDGWRGGVSAPGDDVGRWTSLADQGGTFLITYYDATHRALKLAAGGPGAWTTHTIDDAGDSGRYSSLVVTAAGVPVVSYTKIAESTTTPGSLVGSVMVATANLANPSGPTDWTITEVASGPMACRPEFCATGTTCIEAGACVTPTSDCAAACASGEVCFNTSCQVALPSGYVEDLPPAYGLYTSLAETPSGLALVYYDRSTGNILGASFNGSAWTAPFEIDGYAVADPFVGDCGQGANLVVDAGGTWHVAYIDGAEETLRYAQVQSDGTVLLREVVDDGSTDGTARHTDGRHIVGDDASLAVTAGGAVRVVYQDATSQDAMVAVRPGGGGAWAIQPLDTDASTGYWLEQQLLGDLSYVAMWWTQRDGRNLVNGVRVVTSM